MPGVAGMGYDDHTYELWRNETAPVGRAGPFFVSSVLQLPRARMPLVHGHKISCLQPLPPIRTAEAHFGFRFKAFIALRRAFAA